MLSEFLTAVGFLIALKKAGYRLSIKIQLKAKKKNQRRLR